jgi:sialate O-acetylesterase
MMNEILGGCLTDNMVLQRDRTVPIWGTGTAGDPVTVGFQGREWTGVVQSDGDWRVEIGPFAPHAKDVAVGDSLTCVVGPTTVELRNVLVGDVWLCLGQSNMDMCLGSSTEYPIRVDGDTRDYPNLRINGVPCSGEPVRVDNKVGALAYHFGRHLLEGGDVPIGILQYSASGESLHGFLSPDRWRRFLYETGASMDNELLTKGMGAWPSTKYDGLRKLSPVAVVGVYWDQGEGNCTRFPTRYDVLLDLLYEQLGELFEHPRMPFLMVQKISLAPKLPERGMPAWIHYDGFNFGVEEYATIGECMRRWSLRDPERRLTVACHDMRDQVHYWGKEFHGRRAARAALAMTQGKTNLPTRAPEFDRAVVEGDRVRVHFSFAEPGLVSSRWEVKKNISADFAAEWAKLGQYKLGEKGVVVKWVSRASDTARFDYSDWKAHVRILDADAPLEGFAIAGEDAVLYPARAVIEGNTVVVSNPAQVPEPRYVAYGLTTHGDCVDWNLYGANGLPVLPFWSGDWPPGAIPGNAWVRKFVVETEGFAKGTNTTLRWEVEGVDRVTIEPEIGEVPAKGERVISPGALTEYRLIVPVHWQDRAFKPWKTYAVPTVLVKPVARPGDLVSGLQVMYRKRADGWDGTVMGCETVTAPHLNADIARRVSSYGGSATDIVFEGYFKVTAAGLCRFRYRDGTKRFAGNGRAILEIGGVVIFEGSTPDELQGACLLDAPGYYPLRLRVRMDGEHNVAFDSTGPGGDKQVEFLPAEWAAGTFWHAPGR